MADHQSAAGEKGKEKKATKATFSTKHMETHTPQTRSGRQAGRQGENNYVSTFDARVGKKFSSELQQPVHLECTFASRNQ